MEDWARDSSDEELSMPPFQLNALTEALLADLDPTGTATQDERAVHPRWHLEPQNGKQTAQQSPRGEKLRGGKDDTPLDGAAATVGGDSVALGPGFAEMARRPPRRPRKQVNFDLGEGNETEEREKEEAREEAFRVDKERERAPPGEMMDEAHEDARPPGRRDMVRKHAVATELELTRTSTPDRPMRRVVISSPRRTGGWSPKTSSPSPKFPTPPPPPQRTAKESPPHREPAPPPSLPSAKEAAAKAPPVKHRKITINNTSYRILRKLGRGGSGRVYEVMAPDARPWAFKAIPLAALDDRARRQIRNEVALLQSLRGTERVVHLRDWCVDEAKNAIHIVMELGQIDLENIINDHVEREAKLDAVFVGYYWREMLRCIAAIHELDVVHSDIKPANFVSIHGVLKIVDFGIAHSIPDDTVNIYLDHRAGTPNYMAPETLKVLSRSSRSSSEDVSARSRVVRFGKPSDMWSLGCVLHLMVYGRQPFAHVRGLEPKMLAITDPDAGSVELEHHGLGAARVPSGLRRTMAACLEREPARRPTAAGLLRGAADGLVRDGRREGVARLVGDVMEGMARRPVRRDVLDGWVAEAMDEVGMR